MAGVLASRPSSFPSVEEAISWSLRTGMCRSREAACISVPSQLELQGPKVGGEN
jgi:protein phosphatase methylesterase 1